MKIWLTGGSGCGKSEVAKLFREGGFLVIDADAIAKETAARGGRAFGEIVEHFGESFLLPTGEIDRRKLGRAVFTDKKALSALNAITHKHIIAEILSRMEGEKNVVVDAPLPNIFSVPCDKTLFVTAPKEERIKRIMARDHLSEADAAARIGAQADDEVYKRSADAVLVNDGDFGALLEKAKKYIKEWFSA